MNFKLIILIVIVFYGEISFCQIKEIDRFPEELKSKKEDTAKVSQLNKLSIKFMDKFSYGVIGRIYWNQANMTEALKNFFEELKVYEELKDKSGIAQSHIDIGTAYYSQDKDHEALRNFYKALKLFEEINDQKMIGSTLSWLGNTYFYLPNHAESEKYHLASLKMHEKIGDMKGVAYSNKVLAMLYIMQADKYYHDGDNLNAGKKYSEAHEKLSSSLKVYEDANDKRGMLETYEFLSNLYQSLATNSLKENKKELSNGYLFQALTISMKGVKLAEEANNKNYLSEYYNSLGIIYTSTKKYGLARVYLDKALQLSKEIRFKTNITDSYKNLVKLDSSEKNYKLAYDHYKEFITYRDSLFNEERTKESTQAKLQYEFDKKEDSLKQKQIITQTKLDSQKKQKNFYLAGAGMLALLSVFVFLNFRNQKKINRLADDAHAKEKAELELQSLRAQLNPHFMFNSLNAIQELILLEENEKSQTYLARFAKLLRLLLENADKPFIPLQRELDFLQLYLSLENLRIPDLEFSIIVDSNINTEETQIPNMILQPYIENAIWHGLSHKERDKRLEIRINNENGFTKYEIEDNGVGRKRSAELKSLYRKEHRSKGMELLSKRFKLLAKEYGSEVETTITDVLTAKDNGTIVTIKVPNNIKLNQPP